MNCGQFIESYDTAGRPVYGWKCYCGTTACLKQRPIQDFSSIQVFKTKKIEELTPEEEDIFYKKALGTKLL